MTDSKSINAFLEEWKIDPLNVKPAFIDYMNFLENAPDIVTDFKSRPQISYSLRAKNTSQKNRDLFVLIDVVDDDPQNRWLSVCFYAHLVTDPEEKGDLVPAGLFGEDAICFNLDEDDEAMRSYIKTRLGEAVQNTKNQPNW